MTVRAKAFSRCGAAIVLGGAAVATLAWATPASAAVTATSSGTVVTVTAAGDATIRFDCQGAAIRVNDSPASPSVACSAVTAVVVNGDGGAQDVRAETLDARFPSLASVATTLGGGDDTVLESPVEDTIDTGPGNDTVYLAPMSGPLNSNVDLGAGTSDRVLVIGTADPEQISVSSVSTTLGVIDMTSSGTGTRYATNAERLFVGGDAGNDTIDTTGITAASSLHEITLNGGPGNDTITGGDTPTAISGADGANTLTGGTAHDTFNPSPGDVVHTGVGPDTVFGFHPFGGLTIDGGASDDDVLNEIPQNGDNIVRVRARPSNQSLFTVSLSGGGQQPVGANVGTVAFNTFSGATPVDRNIVDTVPLAGQAQQYTGDGSDLLDLTVPPGETPVVSGTPGLGSITFASHRRIDTVGFAGRLVHGPWTDPNESFGHRVVRDLYLRFATDAERLRIRDDLAGHVTTPASVATALVGTDGYRGLDVDRAFVRYLDRSPDAGGRAYWIGQIRAGLPLRALRASLLGSEEEFHRWGPDLNSYVRLIYSVVLGRVPDAAGQAYWVSRLEGGLPRSTMADRLLDTVEVRRAIVTDQFLRFLDRPPTAGQAAHWADQLQAATGEQQLVAGLAGGPTYFARS